MRIEIDIPTQMLTLFDEGGAVLREYSVSTSKNGPGEHAGSFCTPRGEHVIRDKIGGGRVENTVFVARRPTGEVWSPELATEQPERDWILSRILWLCGREPGVNRFGEVDSMRRYIYIHGTPDTEPMGEPRSIGCIRMRNVDVMDLFERVAAGTPVVIKA